MISLSDITQLLGWCATINIVLLLLSTILLLGMQKQVLRLHSAVTEIETVELKKMYINYLAYYKIAILIFNLAPYLGLKIMGY